MTFATLLPHLIIHHHIYLNLAPVDWCRAKGKWKLYFSLLIVVFSRRQKPKEKKKEEIKEEKKEEDLITKPITTASTEEINEIMGPTFFIK